MRADVIIPEHIGIIMDGNGRWAQKRGLPRSAGHVKGAEVFRKITRHCEKLGVKFVTVYAFSTENWRRPPEEVAGIMNLLRKYLDDVLTYTGETIKIRFIGDRTKLAPDIIEAVRHIEDISRDNTGMVLNIAVNYGGRQELALAAQQLARECAEGALSPDSVDETAVARCLYTAGQPDVDLILRPSGEKRLSNFMLWQSAYAEFVYMNTLWPDFTPKLLEEAIEEFSDRKRRFGGV